MPFSLGQRLIAIDGSNEFFERPVLVLNVLHAQGDLANIVEHSHAIEGVASDDGNLPHLEFVGEE